MITKWEDIPGVEKVYYGTMSSGPTLVFADGSFAVLVGKLGRDDVAYPVLADEDDEDALYDAVQAGGAGARELLDAAKTKRKQGYEKCERARLAYLQKKYGGVK